MDIIPTQGKTTRYTLTHLSHRLKTLENPQLSPSFNLCTVMVISANYIVPLADCSDCSSSERSCWPFPSKSVHWLLAARAAAAPPSEQRGHGQLPPDPLGHPDMDSALHSAVRYTAQNGDLGGEKSTA